MKITLKYGLLGAAALILLHLVVHFTVGVESSVGKSILLLDFAFYVLVVVLAILERKKAQSGYLTYGNGFSTGFLSSLNMGVIKAVYTYIYCKFINHGVLAAMIKDATEDMSKKSTSEEQAQAAASAFKLVFSPGGVAVIEFLRVLFVGLLIALVVAAFLRNEKSLPSNIPSQGGDLDPYR